MHKVRLIDIAEQVGVSRITVSKVLLQTKGNKTNVSAETASRILAAAKQMGYTPNAAARQLAGVGNKLIGVLIDAHGLSVEYQRVSHEEEAANARGYRLIVGQCRPDIKEIKSYIDDFFSRGIEGMIIHAHAAYPDICTELMQASSKIKHVVYYDRPGSQTENINCVNIDLADGMKNLVRRIVAKGRKKIFYFVPYRKLPAGKYFSFQERERGFTEALKEAGLACPERFSERFIFPVEPGLEQIAPLVKQIVNEYKPDAIIARNDEIAAMTIRTLLDMGVKCPDDIAVAGFDNRSFCPYLKPSLTSVDTRVDKASHAAVSLLVDRVEDLKSEYETVNISPELVEREST